MLRKLTRRAAPILLSAALFGLLGGMGSYAWFFWKNREMCPCAPAGLDNAEGITVVEPYSSETMTGRALYFGAVFAAVGALSGFLGAAQQRRLDALTDKSER